MSHNPRQPTQREIIDTLQVAPRIEPEREIERRVEFLDDCLGDSGQQALVLGISGGVDSTTAGRLCQLAVAKRRARGAEARFFAIRLPHGEQKDAADCRAALAFIAPDETFEVNIEPPTTGMQQALSDSALTYDSAAQQDFVLGNIKARQRMIAQYAIAGRHRGLVVGTDHAAEAVVGFFTKFGDGAVDVTPLTGLNKRQVGAMARALGAPNHIIEKKPTADLESLRPQLPDEKALGLSYDAIDTFLEGGEIDPRAHDRIVATYQATAHKRALPTAPAPPTGS